MSLQFASLNSGSNGNCYYVGNSNSAILVDAGISCRETEKRMARLGLSLKKVKAIFISHEHTDHISGVEVLSRKHKIPVYITAGTLRNSRLQLQEDLTRVIRKDAVTIVEDLVIKAFPKRHDAADPCSFVIEHASLNVGVFTDIGGCCSEVISNFAKCNAVFLEANYDTDMLMNGHYPFYLKRRISGGHGHLSNAEALELFVKHRSSRLTHLLLSHLSKENNSPQLVHHLFKERAGHVHIEVASRHYESNVHTIGHNPQPEGMHSFDREQLSLF